MPPPAANSTAKHSTPRRRKPPMRLAETAVLWDEFGDKAKLADYLLDVSKLVFAGVVLVAILRIDGIPKLTVLIVGVVATRFLAAIGFRLIKQIEAENIKATVEE
ncbi:MAG: DUF6722 family protein [bacterium]